MNVYLYSRVSTDQQSLAQQERTAYEWLSRNHMEVTKVFSDEGISGGVSYKDRKLGKELLPLLSAGDVLIVSEISRLGRSMYDLSKLIHEELQPRKVRLVIVGMGIDLNCNEMKPIDNLILNNFAFAAELEKHLISERTRSALLVKKRQGVKLGSAAPKYKETLAHKTKEEIDKGYRKRTMTMKKQFLESEDVRAFCNVLCNVFPNACDKNKPRTEWTWRLVTTSGECKNKCYALMKDYKELNPSLFASWDFNGNRTALQVKLAGYIRTLRNSYS